MKFILELARPEIVAMTPYSSARMEQNQGTVWLNANENPYNNLALLNRYPEQQPQELLTQLATLYQIKTEQLLVTRGSDEAIDLLLRVFCNAGHDAIMITPPTYGMYKVSANIQNAKVISVPLIAEQGFSLDVASIVKKYDAAIKLIFLCSPNNPTGNLLGKRNILSLCQQLQNQALVVVDEAYIEFASVESLCAVMNAYPNLVILRTLSKAYGLAGVRCGSVIAHPIVIQLLKQVIAPYPVPRPVIAIILEHFMTEKIQLMYARVALLNQQRTNISEFLSTLAYVKQVWPSDANFILFKVMDAKKILNACQMQGVVIRDRSNDFGLANCLRVTVGTPEENQILMQVLKNAEA